MEVIKEKSLGEIRRFLANGGKIPGMQKKISIAPTTETFKNSNQRANADSKS